MQSIDTRHLTYAAETTMSQDGQLPVFDFMAEPLAKADCCWEEHGYRTLINNELKRQERPITFLVQPLGRSRSYVSRVLSGQNKLTQELREKPLSRSALIPSARISRSHGSGMSTCITPWKSVTSATIFASILSKSFRFDRAVSNSL